MGISDTGQEPMDNAPRLPKYKNLPDSSDEKVISVRITSSVAVGRGRGKPTYRQSGHMTDYDLMNAPSKPPPSESSTTTITLKSEEIVPSVVTDVPPNLIGANIEYIKQLNAKKETKEHSADVLHPSQFVESDHIDNEDEHFQSDASTKIDEYEHDVPLARKVASTADANRFQEHKIGRTYQNTAINRPSVYTPNYHINVTSETFNGNAMNADDHKMASNSTLPVLEHQPDKKESRDIERLTSIATFDTNNNNYQTDDSVAESSIKSVEFAKYNENIDDIPPTATIPSDHSMANPNQGLGNRPINGGRNNARLTTVSFNIVHDTSKATNDNEPSNSFITSSQVLPNQPGFYDPPKIYSQPAQIYSEPAKFYSEPAKIYSEPAKIYSEPAKVYSEPAKIYSEPSKFYSEPASLHLNQNVPPPSMPPNYSPWQRQSQRPISSTVVNTTPITTATNGIQMGSPTQREHQPEKNYEVDEKVSVLTDGRSHGVQTQETSTEKCKQDNCKVGYVVEGRQFKKYRVEERTSDGFIVGEYGVVRNEDGALRGVRYTADSDASPRLIHDALMKFLQLK